MKKLMSLLTLLVLFLFLVGCDKTTTTKSEIELERQRLNKIQEAIYMVDYPARQGEIITGDLDLPTSYRGVSITWETLNFKDIISPTGEVTRPDTCWIESRDQQGQTEFPDINNNWPVILQGTFSYEGMSDTHKLLVVVKPADGFTCDKYKG